MVLTVYELESLFIQKFCERYKLTERDVKRAFAQFDTDKNGLIDLAELTKGFRSYLNGFDDKHIAELVKHYDVNGDGSISFEEFYRFLVDRSAVSRKPSSATPQRSERPPPAPSASSHRPHDSPYVSPPSIVASSRSSDRYMPPPIPSQSCYDRYDMSDMRSEMSSVLDPEDTSAIQHRARVFLDNLKHFLNQNAMETRQRDNIRNRLQVHSRELVDNVGKALLARELQRYAQEKNRTLCIDFLSFCKVMRSFDIAGISSVSSEVLQYIYAVSAGDDDLLNPLQFVALLYDSAHQSDASRIDRVGYGDYKKDALMTTSDPASFEAKQRYICSKSRTTYLTPSGFDSSVLALSSQPPQCSVRRSFVMGLRTQIYSGDVVTCINNPAAEERTIAYAASSLGVVHNLTNNTQIYFEAHDDEITCITVDPSYTLAASGQLGRDPALYIWDLATASLIRRIGKGFFSRAVCAVSFSYDSTLVCAVGCDDKHSLGVWDLRTGDLIVETTATSGIPPQVRAMSWCQAAIATPYITRHHTGKSDLIVTAGERSLRFWSLQRAQSLKPATIAYKMATFGLTSKKSSKVIPAPKMYLTTAYLASGDSFDVLAGGDNGVLYLFKESVCAATVKITRGSLHVIKVVAQSIFCGTNEGSVCLYDASLTLVSRFDAGVIENLPLQQMYDESISNRRMVSQPMKKRGTAAQRSKSAGRTRPLSSAPSRTSSRASSRDDESVRGSEITNATTASSVQPCSVIGISVDLAPFYYQSKGSGGDRGATLVAVTSTGKCVRIHVDAPRAMPATELFTFHTGSLWGLAAARSLSIFVTGGDDCWLSVWDSHYMKLVTRYKTQFGVRCCCFNQQNNFIAVGMVNGYFAIHYLELVRNAEHSSSRGSSLTGPLAHRKDCKEDISDIKFNPACDMLAVGSHDNFIDVYSCALSPPQRPQESPQCRVSPLHRLRGHSSYITHLDWSRDGQLIQSTCGAYELLYWDVHAGRQYSYATGWCAADLKWKTNTCILGFNVMGIWPKYADGTDINSIDVSRDRTLVATADDSGKLNIMNYPCVAKNAPRITLGGHSSHVMNVTFMEDDSKIATVGGNDNCAIVWSIVPPTARKTYRR